MDIAVCQKVTKVGLVRLHDIMHNQTALVSVASVCSRDALIRVSETSRDTIILYCASHFDHLNDV